MTAKTLVSIISGTLMLSGLVTHPTVLGAQTDTASLEVTFTVPDGYVAKPEGGLLWISPQTIGWVSSPCIYGFAPPRSASRSLEADAEAALVETVAGGMRRSSDYRIAVRGTALAGWPYFLSGANFQGQTAAGESLYLAMMAMVFPAPANRVNVMFGVGKPSECFFNDVLFAQLFHSLRPRGWSGPTGHALERDLIGTWGGSMLSGHTFHANGRYANSAAGVLHGAAVSAEGGGIYALRGSEVTITTRPGRPAERFRVHIYDKWNNSRWERTMTVLFDSRGPSVAEYVRAPQ